MFSKAEKIYLKYRDCFDSIEDVYMIADHLNMLYEEKGIDAARNWFRSSASDEYKNDFLSLINMDGGAKHE